MPSTPFPLPTGSEIPGFGRIVRTSDTAYQVESGEWVPFYGPRGVHTTNVWAEGLVTFADGSRFGGGIVR